VTEFIPFRSRCLGTVTYASLVFSQDGNLTIIKENLSAYVRKWENHPTSFKQNIFPSFCYTFIHVVPSGFSSEIEKKIALILFRVCGYCLAYAFKHRTNWNSCVKQIYQSNFRTVQVVLILQHPSRNTELESKAILENGQQKQHLFNHSGHPPFWNYWRYS